MKKPYKPNLVEYTKSSTKRKKPSDTPTPIIDPNTGLPYSGRTVVPWDEQKTLPKRFHESGEGTWPALKIIGERGSGKRKEYLLEWEPHPYTNETFRPDWVRIFCMHTEDGRQ